MKFLIHYNGTYQDEIAIEGESVEEIREQAFSACDSRGWEKEKCWSEKLEGER